MAEYCQIKDILGVEDQNYFGYWLIQGHDS